MALIKPPETRSDVDPFAYPGRLPMLGFKDVVNYFSYLTMYLHKKGYIEEDLDSFFVGFEFFIETKGSFPGRLQVIRYNFEKPDESNSAQ